MLDPSPNLLVHGERLEIWDYQLCATWKNLGYMLNVHPAGLKLARENLQSRVKEEDSITNVENAVFDLGVMDSLCPSKLCAPTQPVDDMPFHIQALYGVQRWVVLYAVQIAKTSIVCFDQKRQIFAHGSFKNSFSNLIGYLKPCPTVCVVIRGGEMV
ncbi:hypothetical protein Tco_0059801 [Tanacetum coccineum]